MAGALLEARGIGRRQTSNGPWLLDEVWLAVMPEDRIAVLGPSGAGKTLFLRALALLDPIDAGEVHWRGQVIAPHDIPGYRRQVIYLRQRPAILEGTVEQNLERPFSFKSANGRAFSREDTLAMLAALGRNPSFLRKSVRELSGGELQVVAFIQAIQLRPSVLLLDEPTASVDWATGQKLEELVGHWLSESKSSRALVWVSHDLQQAERVSNRIVTMKDGSLERQQK